MKKLAILIAIGALCALVLSPALASAEPTLTDVLDGLYGSGNWASYPFSDEVWFNPDGSAAAQAKYAGYTQNFGYILGDSGGSFVSLDSNFLPGDSVSIPSMASPSLFRFADDPSGAPLWSSAPADNSDAWDHMLTFSITGGPSLGNYVIAWEDQPKNISDADYQDLVVEVSGVRPTPEPATLMLVGGGLLGLAGLRRKLRK